MRADELKNSALARALGVHPSTVANWRRKGMAGGSPRELLGWIDINATSRVTLSMRNNAEDCLAAELQAVSLSGTDSRQRRRAPLDEVTDVVGEIELQAGEWEQAIRRGVIAKSNEDEAKQILCRIRQAAFDAYRVLRASGGRFDIDVENRREAEDDPFRLAAGVMLGIYPKDEADRTGLDELMETEEAKTDAELERLGAILEGMDSESGNVQSEPFGQAICS
jgi:transposase-like protein